MSAISWKGINETEIEGDAGRALTAAIARYVRHVCEQEYSLDLLELYRNMDISDPLHQHLNDVLLRDIPTLPTVQPLADVALAYNALCRFSGGRS